MPFKSKAQQGFLFAKRPDVAEKFAKDTTNYNLPQYAKKKKKRKTDFLSIK